MRTGSSEAAGATTITESIWIGCDVSVSVGVGTAFVRPSSMARSRTRIGREPMRPARSP